MSNRHRWGSLTLGLGGVVTVGGIVHGPLGSITTVRPLPAVLPFPPGAAVQAFPMAQFLAHWWMFPASILFALVALASGVSGALFFSPFFMLAVGLTPAQAIGAGLLTEVFGMGNGLLNYVRQDVVDYATAKWLLLGAVPAVVGGAILATSWIPPCSSSRSAAGWSCSGDSSCITTRRNSAFLAKARASFSSKRTLVGDGPSSRRPTGPGSSTTPAGGHPASGWRPSVASLPA